MFPRLTARPHFSEAKQGNVFGLGKKNNIDSPQKLIITQLLPKSSKNWIALSFRK